MLFKNQLKKYALLDNYHKSKRIITSRNQNNTIQDVSHILDGILQKNTSVSYEKR